MSLRSEVIRILNEVFSNSKKITELPLATTPLSGAEWMEISQSGISKKVQTTDVGGGVSGGTIPSNWDFATSGASPGDYPTDLTKRYYTTDDTVYPSGTEFWTNGSGGWFTK